MFYLLKLKNEQAFTTKRTINYSPILYNFENVFRFLSLDIFFSLPLGTFLVDAHDFFQIQLLQQSSLLIPKYVFTQLIFFSFFINAGCINFVDTYRIYLPMNTQRLKF